MNGLVPLAMAVVAVGFAMVVGSGRISAGSSGLIVGRAMSLGESGLGVVSLTVEDLSGVVPDTLAAVSFEILSANSLEGTKKFFGIVPESARGAR